jgi:polyisoprenoid-binding protein YceI
MGWFRGWRRWLVLGLGVVVLVAVVAPFVYFNFIQDDAPEKLSLDTKSGSTSTTSGAATVPLEGTWNVSQGSQAGYRIKEVAFGQHQDAVGRTQAVTGQAAIAGENVTTANVVVDMTKVTSDQSRRDNQFHGRIMNTSQFPTSTFKLTQPITLSSTSGRVTTKANGELTLKGATRPVVADIQAERTGNVIRVSGSIPVRFADYNIANPSFGPVTTEDHGIVEFLVNLDRD